MIIRNIKELEGTDRDVPFDDHNRSLRLILSKDGMGFSFHKTLIKKGGPYHWHYKHHLETCFCTEGHGIIRDLESGESHVIKPDTIYILDHYDNHTFEALKDTILISLFNPPVKGREVHQKD